MFAATKLVAAFSILAAAASAVCAAPAVFNPQGSKVDIVFRPPITAPVAGDAWTVGSVQTITWSTDDIPEENKLQTGLILLGHVEGDDTNEHLDVAHPLASNFRITDGAVNVTVPDVDARDDYIIVLFGDSGNASPKFTITAADLGESTSIFTA